MTILAKGGTPHHLFGLTLTYQVETPAHLEHHLDGNDAPHPGIFLERLTVQTLIRSAWISGIC